MNSISPNTSCGDVRGTARSPDVAEFFDYIRAKVFIAEGWNENGVPDKWGFEFRPHLLSPAFLTLVQRCLRNRLAADVQFCGVEFAGVPLALSLAEADEKPALAYRKHKASKSTGSFVEGLIQNEPIIVVDDVISSGGSLLAAVDACRELGLEVMGVAALVDFARPEADLTLAGLARVSAFTIRDFGIDKYEWKA